MKRYAQWSYRVGRYCSEQGIIAVGKAGNQNLWGEGSDYEGDSD